MEQDLAVQIYGASTATDLTGMSVDIHEPLRDTSEFANATQVVRFFTTQIGQPLPISAVAKTKMETNMSLAGQLPAGTGFLVQSIRIAILNSYGSLNDQPQNIVRAIMGGLVELTIAEKVVLALPVEWCSPGCGMINHRSNAASNVQYAQLAGDNPKDIFVLQTPQVIKANTNFMVELTIPLTKPVALGDTQQIRCWLDGRHLKPTQ